MVNYNIWGISGTYSLYLQDIKQFSRDDKPVFWASRKHNTIVENPKLIHCLKCLEDQCCVYRNLEGIFFREIVFKVKIFLTLEKKKVIRFVVVVLLFYSINCSFVLRTQIFCRKRSYTMEGISHYWLY